MLGKALLPEQSRANVRLRQQFLKRGMRGPMRSG